MKVFKKKLWHGMTFVFTTILGVAITLSVTLENFSGTIDSQLGTRSEIIVSEDDGTLYSSYTPNQAYLNEDGTGNSKALVAGAIDLNRRQASEGSVLLKNRQNALPLAKDTKVTLFGIRSHVPLLGSNFGVKVQGPVVTLEEALSDKNKTDFRNEANWATSASKGTFKTMDDHEYEGAGFKINPVMSQAYDKINQGEGYKHTYNEGADEKYDPKEPSVAEIAAVNANYKDSFSEYGDAAIVVVGRPGSESHDYLPGGVVEGTGAEEPLELTTNEKEMIKLATDNFDKVIVLLNNTSAMEIEELKSNSKISSILWMGFPGAYGCIGVADVLSGKVSPSGGLTDTYAVKALSAPAMMNMGDYTYANASELTRPASMMYKGGKYVIEAEGIYVGYHYYETRYYDTVMGNGNASSKAGTYASTGNWNYAEEVSYTFGEGQSYTTFNQEIVGTPTVRAKAHEVLVDFNVKVTNTGNYAGKSVVQLYAQAPYTAGGIEKSAIQLMGFGKTETLEKGASETLTITVDLQDLASYDNTVDNGDGTKGTYVFDKGNYYFSLGNGAHDALNNVLAKQGKTVENSNGKMTANGDASKTWIYTNENYDKNTFSVSKNDTKISNHLEYADWNHYEGASPVTYLSRNNWSGTYPVEYKDISFPQSMANDLNGLYYTVKTDDDTSNIQWESTQTNHSFYEMVGSDFDDYRWAELLNQLTINESMHLAAFGGPTLPSAPTINLVEAYSSENCGNGMVFPLNSSVDPSAPWTIADNDANAAWNPQVFACSPLAAASFNSKLYYELGEFVGNEALFTGLPILWGPGLNTHRHAYNGRNCEYYSEDPILSGVVAMEFSIAALDKGLIAAPKHFAFNDQETNRGGIAPFMTEQRAREVELRAYQIAFESNKYDTIRNKDVGMIGLMTSFSKIGAVECTTSRGLMTDILKNEWGFHGYAVTDIFDDTNLYSAAVYAGVTGFDVRGASGFYDKTILSTNMWFKTQVDGTTLTPDLYQGDATMQLALKESNHNLLWALCQSSLMNRYNATTRSIPQMTWWRALHISFSSISGILVVGCATMYVLSVVKEKRGK